MTANETYQARRQEINEKITQLQMHLAELDHQQAAEPTNWCLAGEAGRVIGRLNDMLEPFAK